MPRPRLPDGLLETLGGSRGVRAAGAPTGVARLAPVVLLLGLPLVVAVLRQAACVTHGWEGKDPVWRQCGSPLLSSLVEDHAGRGIGAYLSGDLPLDLPVVRGLVTTLLASLSPGHGLAEQRWFLVWWVLVAAVVLALLVVLVGTVRGTPGADPVALALSPVLALSVLLSTELVPAALATGAVWAWTRRRVELAGVLTGLAVLGGRPALVLLLVLAVLPPPGLRRATRRFLVAAGVTLLLVVGPLAALDLGLVLRPLTAWWGAGAGPGSPLVIPGLAQHPLDATVVAAFSALGLLLAAGLVLVLAGRRPAPPVADVALLGLVVVLLTGTSFTTGTAVWLVPFVALAGIRWRDHLVWAGAEAVHLVAYFGWLGSTSNPSHGLPPGWYATALALRLLAVGRLGWIVWARASWGEAVREPEEGDGPADGPPAEEAGFEPWSADWEEAPGGRYA